MRRVLFWSIVAALTICAASVIYSAESGAAYTVVRAEKVFDKSGALRFTTYYLEARRSDGSRVWRHMNPGLQDRRIYFASGGSVRVNDIAGRKSTYPLKQVGGMVLRDPAAGCETPEDKKIGLLAAGQDFVNGHRAVRFVMAPGKERFTMWYSLEFGCAILRQRYEHENGVSEQDLTSLTPGEPEASLFEVSGAFQEVPPSRLFDCPL